MSKTSDSTPVTEDMTPPISQATPLSVTAHCPPPPKEEFSPTCPPHLPVPASATTPPPGSNLDGDNANSNDETEHIPLYLPSSSFPSSSSSFPPFSYTIPTCSTFIPLFSPMPSPSSTPRSLSPASDDPSVSSPPSSSDSSSSVPPPEPPAQPSAMSSRPPISRCRVCITTVRSISTSSTTSAAGMNSPPPQPHQWNDEIPDTSPRDRCPIDDTELEYLLWKCGKCGWLTVPKESGVEGEGEMRCFWCGEGGKEEEGGKSEWIWKQMWGDGV